MDKKDEKRKDIDLINLYKNYLHTIETYREFGDKYGDTIEIIELYKEKLEKHNIKVLKLR